MNSLPCSLPEEQTLPNSLQPTPQGCERSCLLHEEVTTKDDFISLYPIQVWKTSDNCREGSGGTEPEPEHSGVTRSLSAWDRPCAPLSPPITSYSQIPKQLYLPCAAMLCLPQEELGLGVKIKVLYPLLWLTRNTKDKLGMLWNT